MLTRNTRQLKHGDLVLTKNRFEFGIGIDRALVRGVLQAISLDVVPDFLNHLGTRYRFWTDYRC